MNEQNGFTHSTQDVSLVTQSSTKQLGEFLSSLLGQRRTLSQDYDFFFKMDMNWLVDLNHSIKQRIERQNDGKLIKFECEIIFLGGKHIKIGNEEDFVSFADVSDSKSIACKIHMSYLIHFPNREQPEVQEIFFSVASDDYEAMGDFKAVLPFMPRSIVDKVLDKGHMRLRLQHTDITWAEDIVSLVTKKIKVSFRAKNGVYDQIRSFLLFFTPFSILIPLAAIIWLMYNLELDMSATIREFEAPFRDAAPSLQSLSDRLNALYELEVASRSKSPDSVIALSLFLVPFIMFAALYAVDKLTPRSFFIANEYTRNLHSAYIERRNRLKYLIGFVIVAGLMVAIAGSLITDGIRAFFASG